MRDIKFEYLVIFESGDVRKTVLTLEEIEKSTEFSSFGQAVSNIGNGVKEIHRRQLTGRVDENKEEIAEGDILGIWADDGWLSYGTVAYGDDNSLYAGMYYLCDKNGYSTDWASEDDGKPENWCSLRKLGNKFENPEMEVCE